MATTDSLLGKNKLDLGPANIYVKPRYINAVETDWEDSSDWIYLGDTESATKRIVTTKTDLMSSQKGARAADKVITAQQVQIETSLGAPYLERLEYIQQGLKLIKDSSNNITRWVISDKLGERDSDVELWIKFVSIEAGVESTDPLDTSYMKVAPATETVELVFDAASQRFYGVVFEAYKNDTGPYAVQDEDGAYCYDWSAEVI